MDVGALFSGSSALEWGSLLASIGLLILLRLTLPTQFRKNLRAPFVWLVLYFVFSIAEWIGPADGSIERVSGLLASFVLALSLIRLVFAFFFEALPLTRGRVPRIVEDILTAVAYFIALMALFSAGGVDLGSIVTASAIVTGVVAFALQDTLGNVIAGLAIQIQKPYEVGDWVSLTEKPDQVGRVVEINWRVTKVVTNDQVAVLIPNSQIAKAAVVNYTKPSKVARRSLRLQGPYEAPPARVQEFALRAIRGCPDVLAVPEPDVVLESFADSGIVYWCRFFIDDFQRRDIIAGLVAERVYYELHREGIRMPYPVRTVHMHERSDDQEKREEEARIHLLADRFRSVDFLAPLGAAELTALARRVKSAVFGRGEVIVREGEPGADFYMLERGEVSVVINPGGRPQEIARLKAGDFFGEMSLMTGEVRRASVVALGDVSAVRVDRDSFREVLSHNPKVVDEISRVLAIRQSALEEAAVTPSEAEQSIARRSVALMSVIRGFFRL